MSQQFKIGLHKTKVQTLDNGNVAVTYHNTRVIEWSRDTIILNSGGWNTLTTKTRINQACNEYGLGISVIQRDYEWFVVINESGKERKFTDNMVIKRDCIRKVCDHLNSNGDCYQAGTNCPDCDTYIGEFPTN